mmetsp:Transcript_55125/g.118336  ORF Transcript_55125/g.118336 Transcript_55125/m.118336 type:complete len:131 (+) Transcript_55125:2357-2749(+)
MQGLRSGLLRVGSRRHKMFVMRGGLFLKRDWFVGLHTLCGRRLCCGTQLHRLPQVSARHLQLAAWRYKLFPLRSRLLFGGERLYLLRALWTGPLRRDSGFDIMPELFERNVCVADWLHTVHLLLAGQIPN